MTDKKRSEIGSVVRAARWDYQKKMRIKNPIKEWDEQGWKDLLEYMEMGAFSFHDGNIFWGVKHYKK